MTNLENIMNELQNSITAYFAGAATDFQFFNINKDPNHLYFTLEFLAFNYFWISITYDSGRLTKYITQGKHIIYLDDKRIYFDDADFNLEKWTEKLYELIKIRIPEHYLEYYNFTKKE